MRRAECLKRPDLHLSETLSTELRLTTERLLCDERVGTDGTCVHLVLDHVTELKHVDHTNGCGLVETVTCTTVVEVSLTVAGKTGLVSPFVQVVERGTVENRSGELLAELTTGPTENSLENLTEVHTRRHTQRVQHDIYRSTILKERHILLTYHTRHDTLVTVATCHLVTHTDLTLLGDVDLGHLHDARGELVTDGEVEFLAAQLAVNLLRLAHVVGDKLTHHAVHALVGSPVRDVNCLVVDVAEVHVVESAALRNDVGTDIVFHALRNLILEKGLHLADHDFLESILTLLIFSLHLLDFGVYGVLGTFLLDSFREEVAAYHDTLERGRSLERGILHVTGTVTEDGAEKFLLGSRVRLTLGGNLTDHDVARHNIGTYADDTLLVEVLGSVLAHVGDIGGKFLHTALCLAHVESVLVDVNRSKDVLANHALVEHNGVLIVVTLPGHEGHLQVAAESELTLLGRITLGEDVALLHTLSLVADGTEVDSCTLVRATELGQFVFLDRRLELNEFLVFSTVVADTYHCSVNILDHTGTFGHDLGTRVADKLTLDTCADDRSLAAEQRNCLAHHVRSHQRTVSVVMLKERYERCCDRCNLDRSHIHELELVGGNDREVGVETSLDAGIDERAVVVDRRVTLRDHLTLLDFGGEIDNVVVVEVNHTILHLAVRSLDEAEVVDLRVNAKRRNQTDVRAFRGLDRTETAVVGVVNVSNLEACTLTRQTAGTKGRHTALVGNLGQRVCLVHELRQRVRTEERVDHSRDSLGIDQVNGLEHLVVADVHLLTDRT